MKEIFLMPYSIIENSDYPVNFGEISYLVTSKKNRNGQELGLILTGNFIEKGVIDKKVSLNKFIHQSYKMEDEIKEITTLLK
jgi:hypothetical protein